MDSTNSQGAVNVHKFGTETFAIFQTVAKGGIWMVHFIWGKKDFRAYLERVTSSAAEAGHGPPGRGVVLVSPEGERVGMSRLQYLYDFEWFEFDKVGGHGLAHDEVRWQRGKDVRYVELPKDFVETALELACREFRMVREEPARKAG
ncbi:MAG: hypothetical protein HY423_01400 [Candidatus Lambdaproteobacteria bacterium]|nr:hypothetical protein [Candidatus Lambdaproteobacteria bacterium]